jgi:hypothetical protein
MTKSAFLKPVVAILKPVEGRGLLHEARAVLA